jgi:hypothetical protein
MSPGERFFRDSSPLVFLDHGPHSPPFYLPNQDISPADRQALTRTPLPIIM